MTAAEILELKQFAKNNTYLAHGDISKADCVIGFSFGYLDTKDGVKPGKSNAQLADFIKTYFPNKPLILQFEISDALKQRTAALVIRESRKKDEYLNSKEIAEQALIFMNQHNWKTAAIVTHPAMVARNDTLCQKLGILTVVPNGLETIEYETNSAQAWTRDKNSWWERESKVIDFCLDNDWL